MAQDDGGLRVRLGIQQSFAYGDNVALGVPGDPVNPEEGASSSSTTAFALQIDSVTRDQRFLFQTGGAYRFASLPAGNTTSTGFVDPFMVFSYTRQGANARFSFSGEIRESDISRPPALWNLGDEDNVIRPPTDLADLRGTGNRREYRTTISLETGVNSPLGFRLRGSAGGIRYDNASTPNLIDNDRTELGLTTFFRFDQATTAVLDLRSTNFSDDSPQPDRKTRVAEVGFDREFANLSQLSARIGYTDGDPNNVGNPSSASGVSGSLTYRRQLHNGTFDASYSLRRTANGEIDTISAGRQMELPTGSLRFKLGATQIDKNSAKPVGGVSWTHRMPATNVTLRLDRAVTADSTNQDRLTTTLAAQFRREVSPLSSFYANFSYYLADGTVASNQVTRSNLALGYEYALTEDWNLNTGVNLRVRDENTVGKAESQEIFMNLSRKFDLF